MGIVGEEAEQTPSHITHNLLCEPGLDPQALTPYAYSSHNLATGPQNCPVGWWLKLPSYTDHAVPEKK